MGRLRPSRPLCNENMRAALILEKAPFEEVMALDTEVVAEDPEMV